jgi:hypothetical protein
MRAVVRMILVVLAAAVLPASAGAQALGTVTGAVKDSSGAVLPGATVEAASPVLIEKVRTAVTDGAGLYRLVNLPPGAYTLTFSLPGFNTVRREGVQLSVGFIASIDAELRIGSIEETVTVTRNHSQTRSMFHSGGPRAGSRAREGKSCCRQSRTCFTGQASPRARRQR